MNTLNDDSEKKQPKKYALTKMAWFKLAVLNIVVFFVTAFIFDAVGSYSPFRYAWIISIGFFFLSVMIATNVKRQKPWSRFRWE